MINFFGKTRKKLADNNQFLKYSRYAIGEIALVMIGILLALQVNNWNEKRKIELSIELNLNSLKNEIISDTLELTEKLEFYIRELNINESLLKRINHDLATVDTMIQIARFEFSPRYGALMHYSSNSFESMRSTGEFGELTDSLKNSIIRFYSIQQYHHNNTISSFELYRDKLNTYSEKYNFESIKSRTDGPLISNLIWDNIDFVDMAPKLSTLMKIKSFLYLDYVGEMNAVLTESRSLLKLIENEIRS